MRRHLRFRADGCAVALLFLLGLSQVGCQKKDPTVIEVVPPKPEVLIAAVPQATPLVASPTQAPISQDSIDLIVNAETGGKSYYDKKLIHPTWPGAYSGTTVGVGYDAGQTGKSLILSDWYTLRDDWRNDLADTSGITGQKAKSVAQSLGYISIDWSMAMQVFQDATLPQYWSLTKNTFPGVQNLCPNASGALCSIVYNRGSSMVGSSREEMRKIRDLVPLKDYQGIAQQIISMKRLWEGKGLDGLLKRRDAEAALVLTCATK